MLGLRVADAPLLELTWRSHVSLQNPSWISDHVIEGYVTFHATVYLCMAIETQRQLSGLKDRKDLHFDTLKYMIQGVSFLTAILLPRNLFDVELHPYIRLIDPMDEANQSLNEFRIHLTRDGFSWTYHCCGRITICNAPESGPLSKHENSLMLIQRVTLGQQKLSGCNLKLTWGLLCRC